MNKYSFHKKGFSLICVLFVLSACLAGLALVYEQATYAYMVAIKRYHAYQRRSLIDAGHAYACARMHAQFDIYAKRTKAQMIRERVGSWGVIANQACDLDLVVYARSRDELCADAILVDGLREMHAPIIFSRKKIESGWQYAVHVATKTPHFNDAIDEPPPVK